MRASRSQYYRPFDPRSIPGCMMWIDANDSNSFTLSGNNVTALSDKSGSGTTVDAITGTPVWTSNGLNSRPTIDLTSGNFRGTLSSTRIASNYTHSTFMVTRLNSAAGAGSPLLVLTNPQTSFTVFYRALDYSSTGPNFRTVSFFATTAITTIAAQTTSPFIWQEYYEGDQSNNSIVSLSNGASQNAALAGAAPTTSPGFFTIGTEWNSVNLFSRFMWPGTVSEILVYNNILTTAQRQHVEGYLAWKWGLTTSLPATHPNRFTPSFQREFVPTDIGACEYWFDATDSDTITASGTTLTTWSNKGTTPGSNLTTGTGTITTGSVSQQNGLNVVGMGSGIGQFTAAFPTQGRTRFFAVRPTVDTGASAVTFLNQTTGTGRDTILLNTGGIPTELAQGVAFRIVGAAQTNQSNVFGIWTFRNASGNIARNRIALNGNSITLSTNTLAAGYLTSAATTQVGSNVDVGEWISFNSQLGLVPTFQVEGYLAWKWGLWNSLPSTHLFREIPPTVPAFIPTMITGCVCWWDAADPTQFTGGSTWGDKSGSNNTGINGTPGASTMPSVTTWTNGNQAARFVAGSKNSVKTTSNIPNLNVTYFMVSRIQAAVGLAYLMINNVDGQRQIFMNSNAFPVGVFAHANSTSNIQVISVAQSEGFLYGATISNVASGFITYANGTANAGRNVTTSSASQNYFGSANGDSGYTTMDVGEILIYNTILGGSDRQRVEGYLAWKWGLETRLPVTHPFRRVKP